ncbi:hypothetical protein NDN08_006009 [Rhodosorus marinus]|uniref:Uncharacterized protein n=1 Tax=Rhodosorus marinus TaxID=101924 RepID=A0AAV8UJJ8_9RHOD|nr:hypothetical protein NDN08_006009 [Rhodosorus marinus]
MPALVPMSPVSQNLSMAGMAAGVTTKGRPYFGRSVNGAAIQEKARIKRESMGSPIMDFTPFKVFGNLSFRTAATLASSVQKVPSEILKPRYSTSVIPKDAVALRSRAEARRRRPPESFTRARSRT